jgi:guanylate kinase
MSDYKGLLFIVSGFSGAGKGTIVKAFLDKNPDVKLSISATTRECRVGEAEGVHYYYISTDEFEDMIEKGDMFEHAKYVGNYYGTPKSFVMKQLDEGNDVILEIEMQGALQVKKMYEDAIMIFVVPPHASDLKKRLIHRGTETMEVINNRLKRSYEEVDLMKFYDYLLVNDDLDDAVKVLEGIRSSERTKYKRYLHLNDKFKKELKEILD